MRRVDGEKDNVLTRGGLPTTGVTSEPRPRGLDESAEVSRGHSNSLVANKERRPER
jgi:hypothetical protein